MIREGGRGFERVFGDEELGVLCCYEDDMDGKE